MENSNDITLPKETKLDPDKQLNPNQPLIISPEGKSYLITTAKWAHFIAIVGFVLIILMALGGIAALSLSSVVDDYQDFQALQYYPFSMYVIGITYMLSAVILFFPNYYLFNFTKKIKLGMTFDNQEHLNEGLKNLKKMAKFTGIVTIISLGLMLLVIPAMIISIGLLNSLTGGIPIV